MQLHELHEGAEAVGLSPGEGYTPGAYAGKTQKELTEYLEKVSHSLGLRAQGCPKVPWADIALSGACACASHLAPLLYTLALL